MKKKLLEKLLLKFLSIYLKRQDRAYKKALLDCKYEQEKLLKLIIDRYSQTQFGKDHKLSSYDNYQSFNEKISIHQYEDLKPHLLKDKDNYQAQLIPYPVKKWEFTSGSSSHKKIIPYTKHTMQSFEKALFYWLGDLLNHHPVFTTGKIFYSISPSVKSNEVGFEDDSEYLPPFLNKYLGHYLLNPKEIKKIQNHQDFQIALIIYLLEQRDLETLFIWSPTYILGLLTSLKENKEIILKAIDEGYFQSQEHKITYQFSQRRIEEIKENYDYPKLLWPELKLISCWTQASAKLFLPELKSLFPQVLFQDKGLIATEGVFTLFNSNAKGSLPTLKETFFEFIDENNNTLRLHELKEDQTYRLIITNLSGLLRYDMGDFIKVTGYFHSTPILKFIGRGKYTSDLTGEKLTDYLVENALNKTLPKDSYAFIYPSLGPKPHYICITDSREKNFQEELDNELCKILHYQESRKSGQLDPIKVIQVENAQKIYFDYFLNKGMNLGDIKFNCLLTEFSL